jgi:Mn-dependent DtxR family transcriptional regulator
MLLLSFAIVASLSTVGVILVVSMLITPAATALLFSNRLKWVIVISAGIGLLSTNLGFILAIIFETTPAPAMTLVATALYFIGVLFSPSKGLIFKMNQNRVEKKRIIREDILRQVIKKPVKIGMSVDEIANNLNLSINKVKSFAQTMSKSSLITTNSNILVLSKEGIKKAEKLVRAHRLWETYQVRQMGLNSNQIHDEADQLEHFLSEELIDEIDKELGYPINDPHDSPIPR